MKDFYAILEVSPTASQETIREQYLLLIQAWHPDKFPNPAQKAKAEEKCKQINVAYDVLRDPRKRANYDGDVRGASSRSSEAEVRREAEERPQRKQAEGVYQRQAETQRQQSEQPGTERRDADYESRAREEEDWIRIYFEQARTRGSGSPAGVKHSSQAPIRVLIIDDVASSRAQLRLLLGADAGINVVGDTPDGLDAVQRFDALMPDVMVASINIPNLGSLAATEAILRKHPTARVIILSVQSSHGYIRRAAMAGACDYLPKPPSAEQLQLAIRLAAGRPASTSGKPPEK
jgi:CheY-like chemotaxis protein/DnaJ-domain-containing protein 1